MPRKKLDDNQSKQRLLKAATKIFALRGYEGASTRLIAREAGVNISAISYYFGSKEGRYQAMAEEFVSFLKEGVSDRAAALAKALENPHLSDEECFSMLHRFVRGAMGFMLSDQVSPYAIRIIMRELAEPTKVFDAFYKRVAFIQEVLGKIVARLTQNKLNEEELVLCVHAMMGQLVIFRTHREVILRRTGWKTLDDGAIQKIADIVLPQFDAIIQGYRTAYKEG